MPSLAVRNSQCEIPAMKRARRKALIDKIVRPFSCCVKVSSEVWLSWTLTYYPTDARRMWRLPAKREFH